MFIWSGTLIAVHQFITAILCHFCTARNSAITQANYCVVPKRRCEVSECVYQHGYLKIYLAVWDLVPIFAIYVALCFSELTKSAKAVIWVTPTSPG